MSEGLTVFEQKLAEKRAAREADLRAAQQKIQHDADLIPDFTDNRTDADREMDQIIDRIDIIDGYTRWCGKMVPKTHGTRAEGIKISCPIPSHEDKDPSAWINTDKQVWFCGGCQEGGDVLDIAAYHFGYPVPGYKDGAQFHNLRRDMAKDLGYTFTTLPGNVVEVTPPVEVGAVTVPEPIVEPDPEDQPTAEVTELYDDEDYEDTPFTPLDWKAIVPKDTYLDAYMRATCVDDVPEEFHFWNGLLGLGFALGRDVTLQDFVPVYGNLFVCTIGRSGSGKSRARAHLERLLAQAMPHDWSNPLSKGVRKVNSPGSAEAMIHNFQKPVEDPSNPKKIAYYAPVRGLIDFNELSALIGRANRMGNVTIPTLMQFYDMEDIVGTSSMTHGSKEAHQPFASALTTTQPRALRNLITKADDASGFLNRWIFAPGTEKKRFAIGGVKVDMKPVSPYLERILGWAGSFGTSEQIIWDDDAANRFTKFFHQRIEIDKKKSQSDLIIRIDLVMKKLILLFAANRMERSASLRSVEDAISCYDYLIAAFGIPEAQIGNTLQNEISESVLSYIKRNPKGVTLNQIARSLWRRKYPNEMILKTCDNLVKLGFIKVESTKTGSIGRPTTRYKISA